MKYTLPHHDRLKLAGRAQIALSVRQPWAWLLTRPDIVDEKDRAKIAREGKIKDIENRNWSRAPVGWFLIHASCGCTKDEYESCQSYLDQKGLGIVLPDYDDLLRGGFVGAAEMVAVVCAHASPWFIGKFGFVIQNSTPLEFRPAKARLMFFPALYNAKTVRG